MAEGKVESVPEVCEVIRVMGSASVGPPDLLIEIPHGATRASEFRALAHQLLGVMPDHLIQFFFVNTDAGAPELGLALANRLVAENPRRGVLILRSCIPRTFVDCNRVIDASPEEFKAGKVTPGVPPYVRDPADLALLRSLHAEYVAVAHAAYSAVCGAGGMALMLHTYAPRSVDVAVDDDIVRSLHHAYEPEVYPTWPLRPEIDLIGRHPDGTLAVPEALAERVVAAFAEIDLTAVIGETYPLHPSTQAWHFAARYPGRALCLEVRRDLLAEPFSPFEEMNIGEAKVERIAGALVRALA